MAQKPLVARSGDADPDSHTAFFYGTLMAPPVLYRVIYGNAEPEEWQRGLTTVRPAILTGYERHRVRGCDYPAIIPAESASVRGSLVTGLMREDLRRLDLFEGNQYVRRKVHTKVLRDGNVKDVAEYAVEGSSGIVEAETYVWCEEESDLEKQEWDFEEFIREKLGFWSGKIEWEDSGFEDVDRAVAEEKIKDPTGGRATNGAIGRQLETMNGATEEEKKAAV